MVAWIFRLLLGATIAASMALGWRAGAVVAGDVVAGGPRTSISSSIAGDARSAGTALDAGVVRDLASLNGQRDERARGRPSSVVILESVDFERSAGGVVARGSYRDLAPSRPLTVVIDAFDGSRRYVASGSSPLAASSASTSFSVSMEDRDDFASFSVRFLDTDMDEVETRTAQTPLRSVPPMLGDDALHAADLGEVASRLAALSYLDADHRIAVDDVVLSAVRRFRRDHGLTGPSLVSVGDLLALRLLTPSVPVRADLASY